MMKNKLKKRIRSRAGETIAEVLISVLIAALALSLLAGMIFAAKRMVEMSKSSLQDYIQAENTLSKQDGSSELIASGSGTVSVKEKKETGSENSVKLTDSGAGSNTAIPVTTYTINDSRPSVVSYKVK